jgi:hypothetical protein
VSIEGVRRIKPKAYTLDGALFRNDKTLTFC